jgi:ferredoxin
MPCIWGFFITLRLSATSKTLPLQVDQEPFRNIDYFVFSATDIPALNTERGLRLVYRVTLDNGKCLGCMACLRCENFQSGEDFKAEVVTAEVAVIGCNQEVADDCPVEAIEVVEIG